MILTKPTTTIGPQHHGRQMSLKAFEFAEVEGGYQFELARGYIIVSEVANYYHAARTAYLRGRLSHYGVEHPGALHLVLGTMECKLLVPQWESERHPDVAVSLHTPTGPKNRTMWRRWIPELTIEVVSESSRDRDYTEKRDEYWSIGVK